MIGDTHRPGGPTADASTRVCRTLALDAATAEALAVVTLYTSGRPADAELAARELDELVTDRQLSARMTGGLVAACAALLALHEYRTGTPPEEALRELGRLVAQAAYSS